MPAAPVPKVVLSDCWIGPPGVQGSLFVRKGTLVDIVPGSATETMYGGPSNLGPPPSDETGDDADHSALGN